MYFTPPTFPLKFPRKKPLFPDKLLTSFDNEQLLQLYLDTTLSLTKPTLEKRGNHRQIALELRRRGVDPSRILQTGGTVPTTGIIEPEILP